jgi:hypothetical protein
MHASDKYIKWAFYLGVGSLSICINWDAHGGFLAYHVRIIIKNPITSFCDWWNLEKKSRKDERKKHCFGGGYFKNIYLGHLYAWASSETTECVFQRFCGVEQESICLHVCFVRWRELDKYSESYFKHFLRMLFLIFVTWHIYYVLGALERHIQSNNSVFNSLVPERLARCFSIFRYVNGDGSASRSSKFPATLPPTSGEEGRIRSASSWPT